MVIRGAWVEFLLKSATGDRRGWNSLKHAVVVKNTITLPMIEFETGSGVTKFSVIVLQTRSFVGVEIDELVEVTPTSPPLRSITRGIWDKMEQQH